MRKSILNIILFPFMLIFALIVLPFNIYDNIKSAYAHYWKTFPQKYEEQKNRYR